jgi:anionic cell wall polymer biosynthesis LytR-Cps2A-Psr (LCP) family protein
MFAVSRLTGLPVYNVAAISFEGFKNAVSTLGGIEVTVPFSFTDDFYPIDGKETDVCGKSDEELQKVIATTSGYIREQQFPCRYKTVEFAKGVQTMDAETALTFVRSRHSDVNGNDFGRSIRQQAFLRGVKDKLLSLSGLGKLIPFLSTILKSVDTDLTVSTIAQMLSVSGDISKFELSSLALTDQNVLIASTSADGQFILVPKPELGEFAVRDYIQSEIGKIATAGATLN